MQSLRHLVNIILQSRGKTDDLVSFFSEYKSLGAITILLRIVRTVPNLELCQRTVITVPNCFMILSVIFISLFILQIWEFFMSILVTSVVKVTYLLVDLLYVDLLYLIDICIILWFIIYFSFTYYILYVSLINLF